MSDADATSNRDELPSFTSPGRVPVGRRQPKPVFSVRLKSGGIEARHWTTYRSDGGMHRLESVAHAACAALWFAVTPAL
jgi:hypothetical protein